MHRKVVTVVFCDVVGSTALGESVDPEALQGLLVRYFERMKEIVERHGGSVEKFIGDAVMAVFGVPAVHEDDALRSCRAAVEMRDAFPELGVQGRIGVNTGEVVTGMEERLATGDAVNVAARLQQAAQPDEVLIGTATLELVCGAVEVEAVEPLELKGKAGPVDAHRLVAVLGAPERSHARRFVGRDRELALIRGAWGRAEGGGPELVTVLGDPGIGKSRLVAEALETIEARVVRGRCLSYGEGITYWPVVEIVKQLDALPSDPAAARAIRSLLGEAGEAASAEEIGWAFRKLLEEQAPLVVVLDDIHWGEETFLDLVEGVGLLAAAPILLLCMARPELLDRRGDWPVALRLEPLPAEAVDALIVDLPDELRERIARAAGGNPLFLTEMLAMAGETEAVEVPPTLRALLAARLDQLDEPERAVLERGSVEGELFHRGAVQALAPDETQVTPRLAVLTRKDLIRPDRAQLPGDDGFRFRHLLIRDAAYDALPKSTRVELHRRFAEWLAERGPDLVELDEILGYHFDQARAYAAELGRLDESAGLAALAAARLRRAGERAADRGDAAAAVKLLGRAASLIPDGDRAQSEVRIELAFALFDSGELKSARSTFASVADETHPDEEIVEWRARTGLLTTELWMGERDIKATGELVRQAIPVLERHGDELGLARAWLTIGLTDFWQGRSGEAHEAFAHGIACARGARSRRDEAQHVTWYLVSCWFGPTPAREALARCREVAGQTSSRQVEATARIEGGALLALSGRFDEARQSWREGVAMAEELGLRLLVAGSSQELFDIERLGGDLPASEAVLREACDVLEELGEKGFLSTRAACLGLCLVLQGRHAEAEPFLELGLEAMPTDGVDVLNLVNLARSVVRLSQGSLREAEEHARQAIAAIADWDLPVYKGESFVQLGEVLYAAGRVDEAVSAYSEALALYEQKENLVGVDRVTRTLESMRMEAAT